MRHKGSWLFQAYVPGQPTLCLVGMGLQAYVPGSLISTLRADRMDYRGDCSAQFPPTWRFREEQEMHLGE
eukprot:5609810-Amphidinium_carterae.5